MKKSILASAVAFATAVTVSVAAFSMSAANEINGDSTVTGSGSGVSTSAPVVSTEPISTSVPTVTTGADVTTGAVTTAPAGTTAAVVVSGEAKATVAADKAVTVEDKTTGVAISAEAGAFAAGEITVSVETSTEVEKATEDAIEAKVAVKDGLEEVTGKISITITDKDGKAVQPGKPVTVTIPYDGKSNAVAYVSEDGKTVELFALTISADKKTATFTTTHFSDYYTIKVSDAVLKTLTAPGGSTDKPEDNKGTGLAIAIVPAAVAAAAVVISKKRK